MTRILLLSLFCVQIAYAQTESPLFKTDKPVEGYLRQGHASDFNTYHAQINRPAITVEPSGDGYVFKAGYDVYRYDENLKLQWRSKLDKFFGVSAFPQMVIFSDPTSTYFMEWKTLNGTPKRVVISRFDSKGNRFSKEYPSEVPRAISWDGFVLDGNLHVLVKNVDEKTNSIAYELSVHDKAKEGFLPKKLPLSFDSYEYEKASDDELGTHTWHYLTIYDNKAIFKKVYFKDIEGEKKRKTMVIKLIELSSDGTLSDEKSFHFEPRLAGDDRAFITPTLRFNTIDNSITITGLMEIDNQKKFNGLYLLKYDYATQSLIYNHEYSFTQLFRSGQKPKYKAHYEIPDRVMYPLQFRDEDLVFDPINNFIDLRIVTDYDLNSVTFFDLKFDKYGDHIQTGMTEFRQMISLYDQAVPKPNGYDRMWIDTRKDYVKTMKPSGWDFVNAKANTDKKDDTWWYNFQKPSETVLIRFDQANSSFSVFSFKR